MDTLNRTCDSLINVLWTCCASVHVASQLTCMVLRTCWTGERVWLSFNLRIVTWRKLFLFYFYRSSQFPKIPNMPGPGPVLWIDVHISDYYYFCFSDFSWSGVHWWVSLYVGEAVNQLKLIGNIDVICQHSQISKFWFWVWLFHSASPSVMDRNKEYILHCEPVWNNEIQELDR